MRFPRLSTRTLLAASLAALPAAAAPPAPPPAGGPVPMPPPSYFTPEQFGSDGTVTAGGQKIDYHAVIGTLVVHPKGWDDAPQLRPETPPGPGDDAKKDPAPKPEAAMSYTAYFRKGVAAAARPVMFLYNGGPGSATVWLHMGAFGPRRVLTPDDSHANAAPYTLAENQYSLLDVADLVFIDAPGTGFGRMAGPDKEKAFWGVDQDAYAFGEFISTFLTKYSRWNSPKYLFGESYGTTRSAVLANQLEADRDIDLNGIVLLSQVLNFALGPDEADLNPGVDLPYELALPTYAATAYYHHMLPHRDSGEVDLDGLMIQAQEFAMNQYPQALRYGSYLPASDRAVVLQRLHEFTGLPIDYLDRADLRVTGGEFEKMLLASRGQTIGRLDTRFAGPTLDPLSKESEYDPQSAAISSAYISAFNDYARSTLHFGADRAYHAHANIGDKWDNKHIPPGRTDQPPNLNVMADLADAMKLNPKLKVQVHGGLFDLATPFFEAVWEMRHLPIPRDLRRNIEIKTYPSGHMVYAHEESLKDLHDNVAAFVHATDNQTAP